MHSIGYFWNVSRDMYHPKKFSESKRAFVFFMRSVANRQMMEDLYDFFHNYRPMPQFLEFDRGHRDFQEVMTRVFLFKNSTMEERFDAIVHHFEIVQSFFSDEAIQDMYLHGGISLWKSEDETLPLDARLYFDTGQRKEGFLTLGLNYEGEGVYHFNFRFDYSKKDGKPAIYVGTLQGTKHGLDTTRALTKKLFGFRPKNFIMYLMRIFTQTLGIENLYVITDDGFYTNSHMLRGNRSKKTFLNGFWEEQGAVAVQEEINFFKLPIEEKRRKYGEIKSQKRNLFRKRYLLMDQIIPSYVQVIYSLLREGFMPVPAATDEALLEHPADYDPIEAPTEQK